MSEAGFVAPEEVILFLFVQQREASCGEEVGVGVNLTRLQQPEPPGSNPILARYTLSPSIITVSLSHQLQQWLFFPPEPGMKPLRRTSTRAQAPLSSSVSRRTHTPSRIRVAGLRPVLTLHPVGFSLPALQASQLRTCSSPFLFKKLMKK